MIRYIPGCICCESKNFGLGSLHDDYVGLAGATTQFYSVAPYRVSGFGGLEVACWPLVPKFAGSNPAEAVGFLRVNKNPQHVGGHGCLL